MKVFLRKFLFALLPHSLATILLWFMWFICNILIYIFIPALFSILMLKATLLLVGLYVGVAFVAAYNGKVVLTRYVIVDDLKDFVQQTDNLLYRGKNTKKRSL